MSDLLLRDFEPRPRLVSRETVVTHPRYPVFDAHNHLGPEFGGNWIARPVDELIAAMDRLGISRLVDLDGGWGEAIFDAHLAHFKEPYPDRFLVFGGIEWPSWAEEGDRFGEASARRLEAEVRRGAEGLKVWKVLGLRVRDHRGARAPVDDPRLDPVFETAAELHIPVLIHIADPIAFFDPADRFNEQVEVLEQVPDWHFYGPEYPPFQQLMDEFVARFERHPRATFVAAHVASYPENLGWVGSMLDAHPNVYVDISARINELGRQPYTAREFFIRYQDRILFGSDCPPGSDSYPLYYRFLETWDEYFDYGGGLGRWRIYGVSLPDEVLDKLYRRNAERVILRQTTNAA
jgi:predicted TIM-barrel fold metal-dependent hydrolase